MDKHGFNIVTRPYWKAKPCKGYVTPQYPLDHVILFYNTETPRCTSQEECCQVINEMQQRHQKLGLADLHFNFLIGSDGMVYEGRGWHRQPSKCVRDHKYDDRNYAIAYIGDWSEDAIPFEMKKAFSDLVHFGLDKKFIKENVELVLETEILPLVSKKKKGDKGIMLTFDQRLKKGKIKARDRPKSHNLARVVEMVMGRKYKCLEDQY